MKRLLVCLLLLGVLGCGSDAQDKRQAEAVMRVLMEIGNLTDGMSDKRRLVAQRILDRRDRTKEPGFAYKDYEWGIRAGVNGGWSMDQARSKRRFWEMQDLAEAFLRVDLLGTPKDYRESHNQYTVNLERRLEASLLTVPQAPDGADPSGRGYFVLVQPSQQIREEFRQAQQRYREVVDKYRLIAGD